MDFLRLIEQYEPKAVGESFRCRIYQNNEIAKNNHYNSRYRYPLGGMATIRRYSQPTGADTFTSPTRTDTLRMARLR